MSNPKNLFFLIWSALTLCAAPGEVAVVVQADENFSPQAWQAMQDETKRIAKQAGIRLNFIERSEAAGREFQDLVVFRMKGRCEMSNLPVLLDERGPFAWAFTSEGNVLPFGEVKCDRVRESVKTAIPSSDRHRADAIFGRALGRVVAHEIYHMLGNTTVHGKEGVARDALSPNQLVAERLDLGHHERATLAGRRDFSR